MVVRVLCFCFNLSAVRTSMPCTRLAVRTGNAVPISPGVLQLLDLARVMGKPSCRCGWTQGLPQVTALRPGQKWVALLTRPFAQSAEGSGEEARLPVGMEELRLLVVLPMAVWLTAPWPRCTCQQVREGSCAAGLSGLWF